MQRRTFISLSSIAAAGFSISGISCGQSHPAYYDVLDKPETLSQLCDLKTLKEIGAAYRAQFKTETDRDELIRFIVEDSAGATIAYNTDRTTVQSIINKKVSSDFESGHTVVVKGWVLAVTEARQCALLSGNP